MSNYTKSTNFATKDALASGNPLKIVKGAEIDTEFNNIATAVATKADLNSPSLVTPALGTPSSGTLTNCTGLPIDAGTTGTLPVARGGSGVTTSTGTGNNVLSNSPTLVTPALGTPSSGTLTNCTGLPLTTGVTGTLAVANGGTGVTTSTGSGNNVLSNSPTLVTPALGTPSSGNLANCTFPTLNQNTTGTAAGLSVTLVVGSGGTGATSFTSGALLKGNGSSAIQVASAADIVGQIGSTAVQNATNATNATSAATVTTTVASGATGTTQSAGDNSTKIATTAYVQAAAPGARSTIYTSGTNTFTIPAGVTALKVTVIGGGGGGGGAISGVCTGVAQGGGGGGGGFSQRWLTGQTPGSTVTVTVGAGGSGSTTTGGTGGTSSFGAFCSATGGAGGTQGNVGIGTPGANGTGSSGDINLSGFKGVVSAGGWAMIYGIKGEVPTTSNSNGQAAQGYGGGGSGAYDSSSVSRSGGNGTGGIVIIEY